MSESRTAPHSSADGATAPHAPERGWSWRLLGPFHVTGVFWYRLHRWGVRVVPSPLFGVGMAIFTAFFFVFLRRIGAAIASNLEPVLGPCGWWERQRRIWRTIWSFAWCLSERYERLTTDRPFRVETEAVEIWNEVARPGRGFVLVTAHLGNYEVGSMLPAQREGRRVHLVREPEPDPEAQAFLQDLLARFKESRYTMYFQGDDPLQGIVLLEALRRGEIVAVQGDRPRAGARSIDATLFGRPFPLPPGPAALARTADVPLLPVFVFREGRRRYRVVFRPPILVPRTEDRAGDLAMTMRCVATEIEWAIRRSPHQWFCFRRLWP
ncbi:MAG TPA: lysophospholipid acyltransferase family protein [Candidatus Polarisedimenticolia bacterium]|nr:lysophospholipid acyltransferase family protein [Candidatus Polarisedimenticolia bacterium]